MAQIPDPIPDADEADLAEQLASALPDDAPAGEPVVSKDDADEADILEQEAIVEDDEESMRTDG
jgi:hypothetical protein